MNLTRIMGIRKKTGLPGKKATGMYSRCMWCGKDDKTYIKKRKVFGGTVTGVWCARCKRTAGF